MRKQLSVLGLLALLTGPAFGITASYDFGTAPIGNDNPLSFGFVFVPNGDVDVTALGYYDDGNDGFNAAHEVGIFNLSGTLLISTSLSAGTVEPLTGKFRYQSIPSFRLDGGTGYILAGTSGGLVEPAGYGNPGVEITGFTSSPFITIVPGAAPYLYQADALLHFPTQNNGYTVYIGPNMLLANAPEPATWSLIGAAGMLLGLMSVRRRRKS